jgi:glutamate racemase
MKIGVFDSGVGGKSVADAVEKALPGHQVIYVQDSDNVPYGTKSPDTLFSLVEPILQGLASKGCEVIVIACNSVSTTIITELRNSVNVPLIGVEPMIKEAAEATDSKIIAVCATPTTLKSARYSELTKIHASGISILEPDCSQWALLIENDQIDQAIIRQQILDVCEQDADVIVLGCTHYHWIEDDIKKVADHFGCLVLQPEQTIIEELKRVIGRLG